MDKKKQLAFEKQKPIKKSKIDFNARTDIEIAEYMGILDGEYDTLSGKLYELERQMSIDPAFVKIDEKLHNEIRRLKEEHFKVGEAINRNSDVYYELNAEKLNREAENRLAERKQRGKSI